MHKSPFDSIEVPCNYDSLTKEQRDNLVAPFYRVSLTTVDDKFLTALKSIYKDIDETTVEILLAEFDWRPRLTGALFAALKRFDSFTDQIGKLLVRSDLCYAGKFYCLTLVTFNNELSMKYLCQYLEYYLTRADLHYDQGDAMCAIAYLDQVNGTNNLKKFEPIWKDYIDGKDWFPNFEEQLSKFTDEMKILDSCREKAPNK